ncbi:MAG TPA: ribbon-helix-helix domain-containing protein [Candidatus Limnocylindrales bacterium]|nr:ribbon-helix-helix domain-containing protein [Candidatus Limnocylindrales bacterium]
MSEENKRERITIRLTKRYLSLLNMLIEKGVYNSRNEAIRDALRIMYEYHGLKVSPEKKHVFNPEEDDASKD